jgi:hypothetical protein
MPFERGCLKCGHKQELMGAVYLEQDGSLTISGGGHWETIREAEEEKK